MDLQQQSGSDDDDDLGESIVAERGESFEDEDVDVDDTGGKQTAVDGVRRKQNAYIDALTSQSGLILLQEDKIRRAYEDGGEIGLFGIFFTSNFKDALRNWTNRSLRETGLPELTANELNVYPGLELPMCITSMNEISEFWSTKRFLGSSHFSDTMARNRYQYIRSNLMIHPPEAALDATTVGQGPLWHNRTLLKHMQKRFARLAVPYGASSLDENSIRTKARTRAKSYIPAKPDKIALRFYAVVGWKSLYTHSIWSNGSGNVTPTTPPSRYTSVFPALWTPLHETLDVSDKVIGKQSPTALWLAMMGHQTCMHLSPTG